MGQPGVLFSVLHKEIKADRLKNGDTDDEKTIKHTVYHPCFTKIGTTCQCQKYYFVDDFNE